MTRLIARLTPRLVWENLVQDLGASPTGNDPAADSTDATQQVGAMRWKIEQRHREGKQLIGLEGGQGRKARMQRNHIACAFLVWVRRQGACSPNRANGVSPQPSPAG
jgi:hypothetical protein